MERRVGYEFTLKRLWSALEGSYPTWGQKEIGQILQEQFETLVHGDTALMEGERVYMEVDWKTNQLMVWSQKYLC